MAHWLLKIKKFSNAQDVNIFSSSNVSFYTILSHVLDSETWIYMPPDPPSVARLLTQSQYAFLNPRLYSRWSPANNVVLLNEASDQKTCVYVVGLHTGYPVISFGDLVRTTEICNPKQVSRHYKSRRKTLEEQILHDCEQITLQIQRPLSIWIYFSSAWTKVMKCERARYMQRVLSPSSFFALSSQLAC